MDELKARGQVVPSSSGDNTAALVKLVTEIGPDISEISRRLGQFKESVRYRYKEKLVKRGFAIKADLDYGALGLTRVVTKLRFSQAYARDARTVFETMSDLGYVVGYAGTMPGDAYIVHAAVPSELVGEYHAFMDKLRERGVFTSTESFNCTWFRVAPMRADCFDFEEGIWDYDWSEPPPTDEREARATVSERKKIDKIDLLLLKELWKDSDRSLMEIQAAIKKINGVEINYKTLGWHYSRHVQGHQLVRDYSIMWHGLKYNFETGEPQGYAKYDYLGVSLIVRDVSEAEKMALRSQLNRLPFLWSEASGEAYYAQLHFPLETVNDALEHLKGLLKPYQERAEIFLLDKREMLSFTIGHNLWDEDQGRWTFDPVKALARLERSALKVRGRTG